MKKNGFIHRLLMLLMLLTLSSYVVAQNQQLTAKELSKKADEALDKEDYKEALKCYRMAAEKGELNRELVVAKFATTTQHGAATGQVVPLL